MAENVAFRGRKERTPCPAPAASAGAQARVHRQGAGRKRIESRRFESFWSVRPALMYHRFTTVRDSWPEYVCEQRGQPYTSRLAASLRAVGKDKVDMRDDPFC